MTSLRISCVTSTAVSDIQPINYFLIPGLPDFVNPFSFLHQHVV